VLPAQQPFGASELPVAQVDNWLVVQSELIVFSRAVKFAQ